ncbi:MAG: TerB family tellurite resistance protein [Pseudomonadota bacterium]
MIDKLKDLFAKRPADEPSVELNEMAVSVGAILVEAAKADEHYTEKEMALIDTLLVHDFGVSQSDADALRAQSEARQASANDIHQFTKVVKELSEQEKFALMQGLWRIALSDSVKDPYEEMLVRRVAGLIYVSDVDSARARQSVEVGAA